MWVPEPTAVLHLNQLQSNGCLPMWVMNGSHLFTLDACHRAREAWRSLLAAETRKKVSTEQAEGMRRRRDLPRKQKSRTMVLEPGR